MLSHSNNKALAALASLLTTTAWADHGYRGQFTFNSVTVPDVRVGLETDTEGQTTIPSDNPATTEVDETTFSVNVEYATVFNSVLE